MKKKDQILLEEAYQIICEDMNPLIMFLPLIVAVASQTGISLANYIALSQIGLGGLRPYSARAKDWAREKKLMEIAERLKDDPEIIEFVKHPRMRGWQEMMKTKLSEDELQYIKNLNRSHFNKLQDQNK